MGRPKRLIEHKGKEYTFEQLAHLYGTSTWAMEKRVRDGRSIVTGYKPFKKNRSWVSACGQYKACNDCREIKPLAEFHKHKTCAAGVYHICKDCKGQKQWQRILEKKAEAGSKQVVECQGCERYMMKKAETKYCKRCRSHT
jgi:hypothetical protein